MIKKYIISGALLAGLLFGNSGVALADHAVEKSQSSFLAGLWDNIRSRVRPLFNIFSFPTDPQPPALRPITPVKLGVSRGSSPGSLYIPGQFGPIGGFQRGGFLESLPSGGVSGLERVGIGGGFGGFLESLPRGGVSDLEGGRGFLEPLPRGGASDLERGSGDFGFLESLPSGGESGLEREGDGGDGAGPLKAGKTPAPTPTSQPTAPYPGPFSPGAAVQKSLVKPIAPPPASKPAAPLPPTISARAPQTKAIHLGVGSKNNSLAYVKEGDVVQFTAMVGFADYTSKDVTNEVKWAILGDVGSITSTGVFTAKLGLTVSEYGQGAGSVTATYSGPEGVLLGKSSIFTVYAPAGAGTEGDIGGQ